MKTAARAARPSVGTLSAVTPELVAPRLSKLTHDQPADAAAAPERDGDERRMREMLDAILDEMPFELRSVFVLHEFEGMTRVEIAKMLVIPAGTIASRLRRAHIVFKSRLGALNR